MVSSWMHDAETAAKVGPYRLSKADVENLIPNGISEEDSLRTAIQYINRWADDLIYLDMAEKQLSKEELDVEKELEEYRRSLLKYRYEQRYINERLDTAVSKEQLVNYYDSHAENFKLKTPIVKARYLRLPIDSPNCEKFRKLLHADGLEVLEELDSLAYKGADRYHDFNGEWVDVLRLAKEFGVDYTTVLANMKSSFMEIDDQYGNKHMARITDHRTVGSISPIEYCAETIKDIIISARKQELLTTLEKELKEEAIETGNFVIY